ncbi:cytochrome c oxidase accessory protein CcoG [Burkholderiaceae bacterium DAT-1]|nr:cytochrome c oxidase accessory protein CcoG [Burkholderiaceae bacterium DAT-1]
MSGKQRIIPIQPVAAKAVTEFDQVSFYQSERKVQPRTTSGRYTRLRWVFVWLTQLFFYGVPWLTIRGHQALLFDLAERRFYLFGTIFLPQDLIYLTSLLLLSAFGLFVWTSIGGRLWCGFSCPQTVYTELFVWIEKIIEGDRMARLKLDAGPRTLRWLMLKSAKQGAWLAVALWTGFTFVGYFVPIQSIWRDLLVGSLGGYTIFWALFYALATYGNAGWLREQVCKYMCPYARFQGAMFDPDTLLVSYDAARGEPRGSRRKDQVKVAQGDCVDCTLCVQVCPAGIDIRDGLQYECIGCGVCIDACNQVMDKIGSPRGLIRFTTENALAGLYPDTHIAKRLWRPRVVLYGSVWLAVVVATGAALWWRTPVKVDLARERAALVRETVDGQLENSYRLRIENADHVGHRFVVTATGLTNLQVKSEYGQMLDVPAESVVDWPLRLVTDPAHARSGSHPVVLHLQAQDASGLHIQEQTRFFGR